MSPHARPTRSVTLVPLAALLLAALSAAPPASAHIVSDRDVALIRSLPAARMRALLADALPDAAGRVGANRSAWRAIEPQADAAFLLADAATRADSAGAETAWRTLDVAFAHQQPSGDFDRAVATDALAARVGVTRWAGEVCRGLVAVMNGPLQERFSWRHTLMLPKLRRTLDWLLAGADSVQARAEATKDAPALLSQARTFLLADGMYHEESYARAGQRAIQAALALQAADGTFRTPQSGAASQAACVWALQSVTEYFPSPTLEAALQRAARSLAANVGANGRVSGVKDPAIARRIALTLNLYAAYSGDPAMAKAAARSSRAATAGRQVPLRLPAEPLQPAPTR